MFTSEQEQILQGLSVLVEEAAQRYQATQLFNTIPSYVDRNLAALKHETPEETLQAMQQLGYNVEEVQG